MVKGCAAALILVSGISIFSLCCPDSLNGQSTHDVEGKISAIDTFKSIIIVKSLSLHPIIAYKDVTLFVGPDTKIMRKGSAISIFDIAMGNPVNVKYADKESTPEALLITVIK